MKSCLPAVCSLTVLSFLGGLCKELYSFSEIIETWAPESTSALTVFSATWTSRLNWDTDCSWHTVTHSCSILPFSGKTDLSLATSCFSWRPKLAAVLVLDCCKGTSLVFLNSSVGVIDTVFRFEPAFADTDGVPLILRLDAWFLWNSFLYWRGSFDYVGICLKFWILLSRELLLFYFVGLFVIGSGIGLFPRSFPI